MREKLRVKQAERRKAKGKPEPKPKAKHNIDDLYAKIEQLMTQYNKPATESKPPLAPAPTPKPMQKPPPAPAPAPKPVSKPQPTGTYYLDFMTPKVPYGNPFKF